MKRRIVIALCGALAPFAGPALAERADRDKPVNIESDRMTAEDAKQVAVFEGKVVLTQGTFQLRADKLTVRQDKDGVQFGVALGKPATFKTKRDGVDEWIDGEAERIEYDGKTEKVEFFIRARVNRERDIIRGNYISYDQRTEFFLVQESKEAPGKTPAGRVTATFQPKPKPPASPAGASPSTNPPLPLQPNTELTTPRQ